MLKYFLPLLPFALFDPALAQEPLATGWAIQVGGVSIDEAIDVAVDSAGHTYAVGYFSGTANFGAGPLQLVSAGQYDAFVMKLDSLGHPVWAHRIGGVDHDIIRRVVVDGSGDILVFGEFQNTVDLDPGPNEDIFVSNAFTSRAFVLKLTGDGEHVWARALGTKTTASSMVLDEVGNIYLGGSFQGVTDLDPGAGTLSFTSYGGTDGFVVKLDPTGELIWAGRIGGPQFDDILDIALDGTGGLLLTGGFSGTMDFDPGAGSFTMDAPGPDRRDVFVSKWDTSGSFIWARQFTSTAYNTLGESITSDPWGNVITTGHFSGTIDLDPGPEELLYSGTWELFVSKLSPDGDLIWALRFDQATNSQGHRVISDPAGNLLVAGSNYRSIDMDPGPGTAILPSHDDLVSSAFLLKLDPDGAYLNAEAIGGSQHTTAYAVALDADGNARVCGSFLGTADFDPTSDTLAMTSHGNKDGWIITLGVCTVDEAPGIEAVGQLLSTDSPGPYYQWVDCSTGDPIAGATAPVLEATDPGSYAVQAGTLYCMPVSDCAEVLTTGMAQEERSGRVSTFPNPATDVFTIQLEQRHTGAELILLDMRGGTVRSERMPPGDRWEMNVAGIARGVYLLEVRMADRVDRTMVVKD